MVDLQFRPLNQATQGYAPRISQQSWGQHENTIRVMHEQGTSRKGMLSVLEEKHSFCPTLTQLNAQMRKWKLRVYVNHKVTIPPGHRRERATSTGLATGSIDTPPSTEPVCISDDEGSVLTEFVLSDDQDIDVSDDQKSNMSQVEDMDMSDNENCVPANGSDHAPNVSGRSALSIISRATFLTHPSDTSSLKEFRATAAVVYKARKAASKQQEGSKTHERELADIRLESHRKSIKGLLSSWLFNMTDVRNLMEIKELVFGDRKESAYGCLCRSRKCVDPSSDTHKRLRTLIKDSVHPDERGSMLDSHDGSWTCRRCIHQRLNRIRSEVSSGWFQCVGCNTTRFTRSSQILLKTFIISYLQMNAKQPFLGTKQEDYQYMVQIGRQLLDGHKTMEDIRAWTTSQSMQSEPAVQVVNHPLYKQLMLLEQQNKKKLMNARQALDNITQGDSSRPLPDSRPFPDRLNTQEPRNSP